MRRTSHITRPDRLGDDNICVQKALHWKQRYHDDVQSQFMYSARYSPVGRFDVSSVRMHAKIVIHSHATS